MPLLIALCVFFTVGCAAYGLVAKVPTSGGVQGRLSNLRYEHPKNHEEIVDPGAGFSETPQFLRLNLTGPNAPPAWEQKLWHLYDPID